MQIAPVSINNTQSFKGGTQYENPINRKTERNLAVLTSVGGSAIAGTVAAGLATSLTSSKGFKVPGLAGLAAMLIGLAFTLPSALYNTKVSSFAREKEMDVFSRQKDATSNIFGQVNNEIKDEEVPLDKKIKDYATVQMANNGAGRFLMTA